MNWCDLPIPNQSSVRAKRGARKHPVNIESVENTENAKNVLDFGIAGENYYYKEHNPPYMHRAHGAISELYVREGVLEKLLYVNEKLSYAGFELYIHDAYRPVEVQNYFHDIWVPNFLRNEHPDWTSEEIEIEVAKYWAKGFPSKDEIDPYSPPPHATGGVVDLTLRNTLTGELLCMGGDFDVVAPVSFADHFEREGELRELSDMEIEAQQNRRILYHAMMQAGFVVHPNEWWHFGFGDQLSAFNSCLPHAVYSVLWLPHEKN